MNLTKFKKSFNGIIVGRIMMAVGAVLILLQAIADKSVDFIDAKTIVGMDKFFNSMRFLLLGSEIKTEVFSFGSIIGFVWLGLIGALLITFGYRVSQEERVEPWIMLMLFGGSLFVLTFLTLLMTHFSSVFSLDKSETRIIKIFQYFWDGMIAIPFCIASYFAHKFFRKKHAVQFGEAKE